MCVCGYVRACVCVYVCACVCVHVCVHVCLPARLLQAANAADDPGYVAPASASHRIHDNKSRQAQQAPQHSHGQDSADFEQRQPKQEKEDIGAPPPALMRVQAPATTPVATDNSVSAVPSNYSR